MLMIHPIVFDIEIDFDHMMILKDRSFSCFISLHRIRDMYNHQNRINHGTCEDFDLDFDWPKKLIE